jgi:D-galactarolactone isomerase
MSERPFPADACDTHMHIYDSRYAAAPTSLLRPPDATIDHYRHVQAGLGLRRVVVVQPTTYGLDNSCTLDAVAEFGAAARAIVVIDDQITDLELERLTQLGARGARFHMLPGGAVPWEMMHAVAERIAPFGWHIQLQMNGRDLIDRLGALTALPTPLVVDHVGRYMPPVEPDDERFQVLLRLLDTGRCWVKLSAPYESAPDATHRYPMVTRLAAHLLQHAPERMLWATNWPHPGQANPPSLVDLSRLAFEWLPDATIRHRVIVDNPADLYQFEPDAPSIGAFPRSGQ